MQLLPMFTIQDSSGQAHTLSFCRKMRRLEHLENVKSPSHRSDQIMS